MGQAQGHSVLRSISEALNAAEHCMNAFLDTFILKELTRVESSSPMVRIAVRTAMVHGPRRIRHRNLRLFQLNTNNNGMTRPSVIVENTMVHSFQV